MRYIYLETNSTHQLWNNRPKDDPIKGNIKYRENKCLSDCSIVVGPTNPDIDHLTTQSGAFFNRFCDNGIGKCNKLLMATEIAMTIAWPTSIPFIPAKILILFVQKVDNIAIKM